MEEKRQRLKDMPRERGEVKKQHSSVEVESRDHDSVNMAYDAAEDVAMKSGDWKMLHRIRLGRERYRDPNALPLTAEEEFALEQDSVEKLKKESYERGGEPLDPMAKWAQAKEPSPHDLIDARDYISHHRIFKKAAADYGMSFKDKEQLDLLLNAYMKKLVLAHSLKRELDHGGFKPAEDQRDLLSRFKNEQKELHADFFSIRAFIHGNDNLAASKGATFDHKGLEHLWNTAQTEGGITPDKLAAFKAELDAHQAKLNMHLKSGEMQWNQRRENKLAVLDSSQAALADWHAEFLDLQKRMERAARRSDF